MRSNVIIAGIGEIGSVFARGFLRTGRTVVPVTRETGFAQLDSLDPELVLIAVGESALQDMLQQVPERFHDRLCLIQNELLPGDWRKAGLEQPTVMSVWFEKKKGQDSRPVIASPAFGPHASALCDALGELDIPARLLDSAEQLTFELVVKNVYILTTNICGLQTGGNVSTLWSRHEDFARAVATEVITLQEAMTGETFAADALIDAMLNAFDGDPEHMCMGRSAPARLSRALENSNALGLDLPTLQRLGRDHL